MTSTTSPMAGASEENEGPYEDLDPSLHRAVDTPCALLLLPCEWFCIIPCECKWFCVTSDLRQLRACVLGSSILTSAMRTTEATCSRWQKRAVDYIGLHVSEKSTSTLLSHEISGTVRH